jgi:iron(II)-dependent oxidoreductase
MSIRAPAFCCRYTRLAKETDKLFDLVRSDALYDRPIPGRHRIIFYRGHLKAFDWNLLQTRVTSLKTFDAELDRLFAFSIDPVDLSRVIRSASVAF